MGNNSTLHQSAAQRLRLRPYQQECIDSILKHQAQGHNRLLCALGTGAGKTVIFSSLISQQKVRTLIIAHTLELLQQAKDKLVMVDPSINVGLVDANHKEFDQPVVIASLQSATQPANLKKLIAQDFKLLVYDECHHATAPSAKKLIDALGFGVDTSKLFVGFTATAFKLGLGDVFDHIAYEKTTQQLIEEEYLVRPKGIKIATDIDLKNVRTIDGDFASASLAQIIDTPKMNGVVVDAYLKHAIGKRTICFGITVAHAQHLSDTFQEYGVSSSVISSDTPREDRCRILKDFRDGRIDVLSNCSVLTEGIDFPETECIIVAKITRSRGLYQQMVGRGLRKFPNKAECIIIDLSDKNHSVCSSAFLLNDANQSEVSSGAKQKKDQRAALPPLLNPKLKSALLNFDPLGKSYTWAKEDRSYKMKGASMTIAVTPQTEELYQVTVITRDDLNLLASNLSFEYAFAAAEDFARANKKNFSVSDQDADWRKLPLTDKQLALFKGYGFKKGIESLTRGQAATIISSNVLKKKKVSGS
jgi:superfamily II DNA or RNA helicase